MAKYSSGVWKYLNSAGPQRPAPPWLAALMSTGGCVRSRARSVDVVITATAPSDSIV